MTTLHRQRQQHERQRNEYSYQGHWGFPGKDTKYGPRETKTEKRWNTALLVVLTAINVIIVLNVVLILWK